MVISGAVIDLVGDNDTGPDIGTEVHIRVTKCRLAASQIENDREAIEIRLQVDFRAETAPRAPGPAALFCARRRNGGTLSRRGREKEFAALTDDEAARIETIYREVFTDAGA